MNKKLMKQGMGISGVRKSRALRFGARVMTAMLLCLFMSVAFVSCKDDDDEPAAKSGLLGEWISSDGLYYSFLSNGTGRYICLPDEPGYDPDHPEACIKHPVDPFDYEYTLKDDILTIKVNYNRDESYDFTIDEFQIEVSGDVMQMKLLRSSSDGVKWEDHPRAKWETYYRYSAAK